MTLLQWSWTVRPGSYGRASLATNPQLLAMPVVLAAVLAALSAVLGAGGATAALVGVAGLALFAALLVPRYRRHTRRLRRVAGADVQQYTLTAGALEVRLGRDQTSIPLADLSVKRSGRDWVAVRRRASGSRAMVLLFDDPALVPRARGIIEQHGARTRT